MSSDMEEDPAEPSQMPSTPAEGPLPPDDGNAAARDMQVSTRQSPGSRNLPDRWRGTAAVDAVRLFYSMRIQSAPRMPHASRL